MHSPIAAAADAPRADWGDALPPQSAVAFARFVAGAFEAWGPPAPDNDALAAAGSGGGGDAAGGEPGRWSGEVVAALAPRDEARGEWGVRAVVRPAPPSALRVCTALAVLLAKMSECGCATRGAAARRAGGGVAGVTHGGCAQRSRPGACAPGAAAGIAAVVRRPRRSARWRRCASAAAAAASGRWGSRDAHSLSSGLRARVP